jgi:hypothetical protein
MLGPVLAAGWCVRPLLAAHALLLRCAASAVLSSGFKPSGKDTSRTIRGSGSTCASVFSSLDPLPSPPLPGFNLAVCLVFLVETSWISPFSLRHRECAALRC